MNRRARSTSSHFNKQQSPRRNAVHIPVTINAFKADPLCRVFLSTDSVASGLNLQNASVVINCDLPWNPAKLEQRIARAWRKHQTRPVTVINLVSEKTIEHRMLDTLSHKQALADGVLDRKGDLKEIRLQSGRQAFLAKLQQLVPQPADGAKPAVRDMKPPLPADRLRGFAAAARERINGALLRCEERYPNGAPHSVLYLVVERDASQYGEQLNSLHDEYFGPGHWDPLSPVRLEVIDRSTDEALQRLIDAGLLARTTRASRPLWPAEATEATPPPLSPCWKDALGLLRQFVADAAHPCQPVLEALAPFAPEAQAGSLLYYGTGAGPGENSSLPARS